MVLMITNIAAMNTVMPLDHEDVAAVDGGDQGEPESGNGEERLDDDGAAEQGAEG